MTDLQRLALEMRRNAAEIDILSESPVSLASKKKVRDSKRIFDYKGYKVAAALTIDSLKNTWAWHLSVCDASEDYPKALPDNIVKEIVGVLLPDGREVPSFLHPGKLRQFLKIVREQ